MKPAILFVAAAVSLAAPAYATYDDALEQCQKFAADNSISAEPCECIAKAIGDDADKLAQQTEIKTLDEYNASPADYRAAVDPCLPASQ